jgi:hypothetical protein
VVREDQLVHGARKVPCQKDHPEERGYRGFWTWYPSLGPFPRYRPAVSVEPIPHHLQNDAIRLLPSRVKRKNQLHQIEHDPAQNTHPQASQPSTSTTDTINQKSLSVKAQDVAQTLARSLPLTFLR